MDIESFYFSRSRKWIFCAVGMGALVVGLFNFLLYFFYPTSTWLMIPPPYSLFLIFLGAIIILIAWDQKKSAFYLSLLTLSIFILHLFVFSLFPFLRNHKLLAWLFFPTGAIPLSNKVLIVDSIFLLLNISLLFNSFPKTKEWHLWIAGACAGAALGLTIFVISFNLNELQFLALKANISTLKAFMALLIACGVFFYTGSTFAFKYSSNFAFWLPTFAAIAAIFLTLSTWMTHGASERKLIAKNNGEKALLLKEQLLNRGNLYFSTLDRIKRRWVELGPSALNQKFLKIDSDTFLAFPWLEEIGLVDAQQKRIDLKPQRQENFSLNLFETIESHAYQKGAKAQKLFFSRDPNRDTLLLVGFSPFLSNEVARKTYFFSVTDAEKFFAEAVQEFLEMENAIVIQESSNVIYGTHAEDRHFRHSYLAKESFDFFDNQIIIEIWPLSSYIATTKLPGSTYALVIGLIFSATLFTALYMAQLAHGKKKEADKANREKTMFLANMSHEIRTPLHGIIGSCSLLAASKLDEYQSKWVKGIHKSGKILLNLMDDLLDISKIEANAITLEFNRIHLKELLEEALTNLEPLAKEKNLALKFDYSPQVSESFYLDGKRIRQIVVHLLTNAIRFTGKGFVKLSVDQVNEDKKSYLIFRVEDTGTGISKERLKNIFKIYLSIDIRTQKGSGLGLAITKRFVELMGGTIEVESEIGKGTLFVVKLPVKGEEKNG